MKGLFDLLNSDDPAVRQGLLQAGLSLLGSKGNFGNALGQAGMAGLLGSQQFRDRQSQQERQKMQDQLMQGQIGNMQREQQIAKLPMQFYRPPSAPAVDATGGMETAAENPANASGPGGFDMSGYADALAQFNPVQAMQLRESMKPKESAPIKGSPGDVFFDRTGKQLFGVPAAQKEDEFVAALRAAGIDPASPRGRALLADRVSKLATHAPAGGNITLGSPTAVQLPDGTIGLVQPPNRPGAPAQLMKDPQTGKPYTKPEDKTKDLTETQAKATAFLGQMQSASKALSDIGADQTALSMQAETALAGGPMNAAIGQKAQRVRQSQDQWSEAFLRFKTGAASTPAEVTANRRMFFPVIGDSKEVIAQKSAMRKQAEGDIAIAAGRGARQLGGGQDGAKPAGAPLRYNPQTQQLE